MRHRVSRLKTLLILLSCVQVGNGADDLKTVRNVATQFDKLAAPTIDVLKALSLVGEEAVPFLKLARPAGTLVASVVEAAGKKKESAELTAIHMLKDTVKDGFDTMTKVIVDRQLQTNLLIVLTGYHSVIGDPLRSIYNSFFDSMNATGTKVGPNRDFIGRCTDKTSSPFEGLEWLLRLIEPLACPPMTSEQIEVVLEMGRAFTHLEACVPVFEERLADGEFPNYFTAKIEAIELVSLLPIAEALEIINGLKKVLLCETDETVDTLGLDSYAEDIREAIAPAKKKRELQSPCLLARAYETYKQDRVKLLSLADEIRLISMQLALMAGLCSQYSADARGLTMLEHNTKIGQDLRDINYYMKMWIERALEVAWPKVITASLNHASTGCSEFDSSGGEDVYDEYARRVLNLVNKRGPEKWKHTVLIWKVPELDDHGLKAHYAAVCRPEVCTEVSFQRAAGPWYRALITRHERYDPTRSEAAHEWYLNGTIANSILKTVQENIRVNDVSSLFPLLNASTEGGITDHGFKTLAILRSYGDVQLVYGLKADDHFGKDTFQIVATAGPETLFKKAEHFAVVLIL